LVVELPDECLGVVVVGEDDAGPEVEGPVVEGALVEEDGAAADATPLTARDNVAATTIAMASLRCIIRILSSPKVHAARRPRDSRLPRGILGRPGEPPVFTMLGLCEAIRASRASLARTHPEYVPDRRFPALVGMDGGLGRLALSRQCLIKDRRHGDPARTP
jgi:hypothetical protein